MLVVTTEIPLHIPTIIIDYYQAWLLDEFEWLANVRSLQNPSSIASCCFLGYYMIRLATMAAATVVHVQLLGARLRAILLSNIVTLHSSIKWNVSNKTIENIDISVVFLLPITAIRANSNCF